MGAWFSSKKIPRPRLVEGYPGRGKTVYQRQVFHSSQKRPYTFHFAHPSATITGIACCPVADENIQTPEATVTGGGVNCKHVRIYLEPTEKGEWAYDLAIKAEENHETKPSQQVGSTDGAAAGGDKGASSHDSKYWEEEYTSETENNKKESSCSIL